MRDLAIHLGSDNTITITAAEIQAIVDDNEEEDVIGVENDIKELIYKRYKGKIPIQIHIRYVGTSPAISTAITHDEKWWAK